MLTRDFFAARVGRTFSLELPGGPVELTLTHLTELPPPRQRFSSGDEHAVPEELARQDPFTLLFRGPGSIRLPQRIYPLTIDGERVEIFIVPVAKERDGYVYEAVFG